MPVKISPRTIIGLLFLCLFLPFFSCKKEGCTDSTASNYRSSADKDDGSCVYIGCMDPTAYNYDPSAQVAGVCTFPGEIRVFTKQSVGNGRYVEVFVDNQFVGKIQSSCGAPISCNAPCSSVRVDPADPLVHSVRGYLLRQVSFTNIDTLAVLPIQRITVASNQCIAVEL